MAGLTSEHSYKVLNGETDETLKKNDAFTRVNHQLVLTKGDGSQDKVNELLRSKGNNLFSANTIEGVTGAANTIIGASTGMPNTVISNNTIIGTGSFIKITTGINNSAVGAWSMRALTTGSDNTSLGLLSLNGTTTGNENTTVGNSTQKVNNTTGVTIVGYKAGETNNKNYLIAIGHKAGLNNKGTKSIALGRSALSLLTSGDKNIAIGDGAMWGKSSGSSCIAIGGESQGYSSARGDKNISVGEKTLSRITSNRNVAIGDKAGWNKNTGDNCIAIGTGSQEGTDATPTNGASNVSIGYASLQKVQSGNNTVVGSESGINLTTGLITAMGYLAGSNLTTGIDNSFFGSEAGRHIIGGSKNTFIGDRAGKNDSTNNTVAGANKSVLIGTDAVFLGQGETNSIVIGEKAKGQGSNTTVIGNTDTTEARIYGNLQGTKGFRDSDGNLGTNGQVLTSTGNGTKWKTI